MTAARSRDEKPFGRLLHYYVHGRGRGHGTRTLKVAETLEAAGFAVRIFSGPDPLPLIRAARAVEPVESLQPDGLLQLPGVLVRRVAAATAAIRKDRPIAVVSDGDLPSLLAARRCNVPSVAVGHAEVFGETRRPTDAPRIPWLREMISAKLSSLTASAHVAVNFIRTEPRNRHTRIAAPAVDAVTRSDAPDIDAVCYFRDENGLPAVEALADMGLRTALFVRDPQRVQIERPQVTVSPLHRDAFLDALSRTRFAVASAGSQLISECAAAGIPLFALYKQREDEQRINVAMLRAAGVGDGTSFESFSPAALEAFVESVRIGSFSTIRVAAPAQRVDETVWELLVSLAITGSFPTSNHGDISSL